MFVIAVEFKIKAAHVAEFRAAMLEQARNSLEREEACRQFDVCFDPKDDSRVFLYEIYDDEAAFQVHLKSAHFLEFVERVKDWTADKRVEAWRRADLEGQA